MVFRCKQQLYLFHDEQNAHLVIIDILDTCFDIVDIVYETSF